MNERRVARVFFLLGAVLATLILMTGCGDPTPAPFKTEFPFDPPSDSLVVNFYLDTSISMQYFLTGRPAQKGQVQQNYFKDFFDDAKSVLTQGEHAGYSLKLWQFGEELKPVKDNNVEQFRYQLKLFKDHKTYIDRAIDNATSSPKHLSVILTDLFESRGSEGGKDVDELAREMADKYLSQNAFCEGISETDKSKLTAHCAIGIFGIRNPFQGSIDELPSPGKVLDAADTLPFYFIIAGRQSDVTICMHSLDDWAKKENIQPSNMLKIEFFDKKPGVEDRQPLHLSFGNDLYVDGNSDQNEPHLQLATSNVAPEINFTDKGITSYLPFAGSSEGSPCLENKPTVQLFYWMGTGDEWSSADSASVLKNVEMKNCNIKLTLDGSKLEKYPALFQIGIHQNFDRGALDKAVDSWSMDAREADTVIRDGNFKDRVGKTMGLKKWTDAFASRQNSELIYAHYRFYIRH